MLYFARYCAPIGMLLLLSDGAALTGLYRKTEVPKDAVEEDCAVLQRACSWLDAYFRGERRIVDFPISLRGTAFQQRVWEQLQTIPYGHTCSYGDIARKIGCRSAQAVGQAVGSNPVAILIPCHRVVGAKGQLTGYAYGLDIKMWLLQHEGILR